MLQVRHHVIARGCRNHPIPRMAFDGDRVNWPGNTLPHPPGAGAGALGCVYFFFRFISYLGILNPRSLHHPAPTVPFFVLTSTV